MLYGVQQVLGLLRDYRLCWISGRFSGGKTSLAYRLAYDFLREGYRLVTTNASVWADELDQIRLIPGRAGNPVLRAVCILDEGGLYFKSSRQIEEIAAYAAKMDVVYLIPSFFPPVKAAQVVNLQPLWGLRACGIPLVVYRWTCRLGEFRDKGLFFWWRPSEVYGVYSRQDPGADPDDVIEFLIARASEFRGAYGHENGLSGVAGSRRQTSAFDLLADAAAEMSAAADTISSAPLARRGRRRK